MVHLSEAFIQQALNIFFAFRVEGGLTAKDLCSAEFMWTGERFLLASRCLRCPENFQWAECKILRAKYLR
jgi:hypothetical protein